MKKIVASQHALTDPAAVSVSRKRLTPWYVEEIIRNEHRPVPWGRCCEDRHIGGDVAGRSWARQTRA